MRAPTDYPLEGGKIAYGEVEPGTLHFADQRFSIMNEVAIMRASKDELPTLFEAGDATIRGADWDEMRVAVVSVPAGTDFGPLLQGQPNDLCPSPHWGYVIKGRLNIEYADGKETLRAGDVFYLPAGHTGKAVEETEFLEVSPPHKHQQFIDVAEKNLEAQAQA